MRRNKLEMLAIEISHKSGKLTKMSDIVNHLLDNSPSRSKTDLLHNAENSGKDKTKST